MKTLHLFGFGLWLFILGRAALPYGAIPDFSSGEPAEIHPSVQETRHTIPHHPQATAPSAASRSSQPLNALSGVDTAAFRIAFYNMENFFDCWHDSAKNDHDFTPSGIKGWGHAKYANKRNRLFKVLAALDAECPLAATGLAEVENARVLRELCRGTPLRYKGFDFVHFESPDPRGIDVALLYRKDLLRIDTAYPIALVIPPDSVARTRDILYVRAILIAGNIQTRNPPLANPSLAYPAKEDLSAQQACMAKERPELRQDENLFLETNPTHPRGNISPRKITLHLFVCHFPSKYGGVLETNHKRAAAARLLRRHMDSLYSKDSTAFILAMGDLNTTAEDSVLSPLRSPPYLNLMASPAWQARFARHAIGSHKFREEWSTIDHIILNRHVLPWIKGGGAFVFARSFLLQTDERYMGIKPFRTFYGAKHLGGYSDHLPVYIDLHLPNRTSTKAQK